MMTLVVLLSLLSGSPGNELAEGQFCLRAVQRVSTVSSLMSAVICVACQMLLPRPPAPTRR